MLFDPLPPLQTLRAMEAVARTRSFTRAGAELGLTQTAVSHQIAQLERSLGIRLFVRNRAGVELTYEGEQAIPSIVTALGGLQQAIEAASVRDMELRVSTTPEFATQWLQPRLGGFCSAHPNMDVSVTIEYRRARLDAEPVGLAIWLAGSLPQPDAYRLTDDHEFVVCSPDVARCLPQRDALRAAPLLRYDGARHTVLDWQRWHGQVQETESSPPKTIDLDGGPIYQTFPDMIAACKASAGFALVRTSLVADELAAGRLVKAFDETIRSDLQYHLVISPAQRRRSDVIAFRVWIIEQITGS